MPYFASQGAAMRCHGEDDELLERMRREPIHEIKRRMDWEEKQKQERESRE